MSQWSRARVNTISITTSPSRPTCTVRPTTLVQELVEVRGDSRNRERSSTRGSAWPPIFVGAGPESRVIHRASTSCPGSYQAHLEWTPSRMRELGSKPDRTAHGTFPFERIPGREAASGDGRYRSCLGIIRLAEQYFGGKDGSGKQDRRLRAGAYRYQSVKSILKNSLDQQPLTETSSPLHPRLFTTTSGAPDTPARRSSDRYNNLRKKNSMLSSSRG